MFMQRLARAVIRRRRAILIAAALAFPVAGVLGAPVAQHLSAGGFTDPAAQSTRAGERINALFHTGEPNVIVMVTARNGTVDDPAIAARGVELTSLLAKQPGLQGALSYWTLDKAPPLRGLDGRQALILGRIPGNEDAVKKAINSLDPVLTTSDDQIGLALGGVGEVFHELVTQSEKDLRKAEALTFPLTVIALLIVFGSAVAAGLPLAIAALAVVLTYAVLRLLASMTDVSIFALNLTTGMGLGLAIDYSLFIVSRFREELASGRTPDDAVARTMHTAGRTIAFSAFTVAVSLGALLVFPLAFLRSFAFAGIAVVVTAGVGAVIVLPALLSVLGPRVEKGRLRQPRSKPVEEGFWYRRAQAVIRRPIPVAVVGVGLLLVLGAPFLRLVPGLADDRVLPADSPAREAHDAIRKNFASNEAAAVSVVTDRDVDLGSQGDAIDAYAGRLSKVAGVSRVDAVTGYYFQGARALGPNALSSRFKADGVRGTWLSVVPSVEPMSPAGEALVHRIRATSAPFAVSVGGRAAELVDTKHAINSRLPLAMAWIAVTTLLLLFLMVGSLLVPVKALALNMLSLSATFGALVWIFQDGHLASTLNFTPTGTISVVVPITLFCIAFGLSMDYEVFLLSRIKEEYDLHGDNDEAVAVGLERTGRIVTAAALLITIVFVTFMTAKVVVVQIFGVGLAVAVLVDAFVIRTALVPAFMRIAGKANWWAPRALRRLHLRFGVWETEPLAIYDRVDHESRTSAAR
ncbi:MAG: MMPL family transporter [Actinobacteria bacterium]|nr:MMPL family transporter [Actinomycetota bacterium]